MKAITQLLAPLMILLAASCTTRPIVECDTPSGKVRLTAVSKDILRVQAVPSGEEFPADNSLCVVADVSGAAFGDFEIKHDGSKHVLKTESLVASVDETDGVVCVLRLPGGDTLVCESSRSFQPIEVEGTRAWTVSQTFRPYDESFYGLGQDQTDEWNWKGRNEELYQYNTKISIPFAVSSRKYGVLWDGYSLTRWGDPRPYSQLGEVFTLYDADGVEGALTGRYVAADGKVLVRRETALAQEYLRAPACDSVVNAPRDFKFDGSTVSFDGYLEPHQDGVHHFYMYYAGYTDVYLDGQKVISDVWRTAWNPNGRKFALDMKAGRKAHLHIDWKPDGDVSYSALKVHSPRPEQEQQAMCWWAEMQKGIDYYVVNGESIDEVIGGYRTLTGKAPIMPKWAMGYWQSRERYRSADEIVGTVREFRRRGIPLDNIVQDWQYWTDDQWGSHEFDPARYPDPEGMIKDVHDMNARFMISVWPKFYTCTEHFRQMRENGWIYENPVRDSLVDWLGYPLSFYDAYAPGARKLFFEQLDEHLYSKGVDAWWMDADEPNIHDCVSMDYWKRLCGPTALGPSTEYLNTYSLVNGMAFYNGQKGVNPDSRVFILSRNGFAGLQRYSAACWSGDIGTRWEEMKAQISAGLNFSISGMPFWSQDIGGFSVEKRYMTAQGIFDKTGKENADLKEWRELQARWHEWGIFVPLYRSHGQWPFREPWNIAPEGHPAYEAILAADRLRYSLLPYIYTLDARVYFDDYTMMRPLVMDFGDDERSLAISDEFMFGDALLVCPVYEYGARSRKVYLPSGSVWYDFHTGKTYDGGTEIDAPAPFERIPLFVRGGSILVFGPDVQSSADATDGSLRVRVYPGADASFELYEDDGVSCGYERGECSRIGFKWCDAAGTLEIMPREGSFEGMIPQREITVELVPSAPDGTLGTTVVHYDGTSGTVTLR